MSDTASGEERRICYEAGRDLLAGLVIFAVSLYVLITAVRMPFFSDSSWMGSPGLTPGLVAAFLMLLSSGLIYRSRSFTIDVARWWPGVEGWRAATVFGLIFAYAVAVPWIGYAPATFLMLAAFQAIFTKRRGPLAILIWVFGLSAALTAALWYLFAEIFMIPLP